MAIPRTAKELTEKKRINKMTKANKNPTVRNLFAAHGLELALAVETIPGMYLIKQSELDLYEDLESVLNAILEIIEKQKKVAENRHDGSRN